MQRFPFAVAGQQSTGAIRRTIHRTIPGVLALILLAIALVASPAAQAGDSSAPAAEAIQELLDKQAIAEVLMTYCRALDRLDEEMLRSVFHPDSQHNHGFVGPSSDPDAPSAPGKPGDFVAYALQVLSQMAYTHHQLGNIYVEVEGNIAYTEAYFTAYERLRARSDPKAGPGAAETEMDLFVGGRYLDKFEKRDGVWKIVRRTATTDWRRTEAPTSQEADLGNPALRALQNRDDFFYRRREVYGD